MTNITSKNLTLVNTAVPCIDFTRLTWQEFETLVSDLLEAEGFFNIVKAGGSGGDMGLDILAEEARLSLSGRVSTFKWMIQVKHYATNKSDTSSLKSSVRNVGHKELSDIIGFLSEHSADGFLVITDTGLTASAVKKITSIHNDKSRREEAHFWDNRVLSNRLRKHPDLVNRYFIDLSNDHYKAKIVKNPFKLLEPFTSIDRKTFFGRTTELEEIVGLLCNAPTAVIFGESGAGKSSILNAAVIPAITDLKFIGVVARCLDDPARSLRVAALNSLEKVFSSDRISKLGAITKLNEFIEALSLILEHEDQRMILALDQFEELFTRADALSRSELASALKSHFSLNRSGGRLTLLFVIREDYLGELWDWSTQNRVTEPWINSYRIRRLSREAAFQAIEGSLVSAGILLDVKSLLPIVIDLERLGGGWTYPPYLQVVFARLYDELKKDWNNALTYYLSAGSAEGIIVDFFENHLFHGLSSEYQITAKQILDSLTGADGMRSLLSASEIKLTIKQTDDSVFKEVLDLLVQRRIIAARNMDDGSKGYELVHDFLAKKFFDKLDPYQRKEKGVADVFRKAMKAWSQYGIYPSQSALEIFLMHKESLTLGPSEWEFLFASAASAQRNTKIRDVAFKERNVEAMLSCLKSKDCDARVSALRVLGKIRDPNTLPYLISRLRDRSKIVVGEALGAISGFKEQKTLRAAISFVKDPEKKGSYNLLKAVEIIYALGDSRHIIDIKHLPAYFRKKVIEYSINHKEIFPEWHVAQLERLLSDLSNKRQGQKRKK